MCACDAARSKCLSTCEPERDVPSKAHNVILGLWVVKYKSISMGGRGIPVLTLEWEQLATYWANSSVVPHPAVEKFMVLYWHPQVIIAFFSSFFARWVCLTPSPLTMGPCGCHWTLLLIYFLAILLVLKKMARGKVFNWHPINGADVFTEICNADQTLCLCEEELMLTAADVWTRYTREWTHNYTAYGQEMELLTRRIPCIKRKKHIRSRHWSHANDMRPTENNLFALT